MDECPRVIPETNHIVGNRERLDMIWIERKRDSWAEVYKNMGFLSFGEQMGRGPFN